MGIALPLPYEGSEAAAGSAAGISWVAGAALTVAETVDQFRRPRSLPPVTGRDAPTIAEMVKDYAAGAAIGVGVWPPGPPNEPDPRLSLGLAAAGAFGAWQLVQLLQKFGPSIQRTGANVWAWLNRNDRGSTALPIEGADPGVRLKYTLSPRRVFYYMRGTEKMPEAFVGLTVRNVGEDGYWTNGQSFLLLTTPPQFEWWGRGMLWGYEVISWRLKITGTDSSGATVTLYSQSFQGVVGSQDVELYVMYDSSTSDHYTVTNLERFSSPYDAAPTFGPAILPAWLGPPPPVLPDPAVLPWMKVPPPEATAAATTVADPMVPAPLPSVPALPGSVPVPAGPLVTTPKRPAAAPALLPAASVPYPLETKRPSAPQQFGSDARQLPLPLAPAPTTAEDTRRYGSTTVASGGARVDPVSMASELGRIEQKLGIIIPKLEGADLRPGPFGDSVADAIKESLIQRLVQELITALRPDIPGTSYVFEAPCDRAPSGLPLEHVEEIPDSDYQDAVLARLDAIASAMGETLRWRRRLCKGSAPQANLTITAFED